MAAPKGVRGSRHRAIDDVHVAPPVHVVPEHDGDAAVVRHGHGRVAALAHRPGRRGVDQPVRRPCGAVVARDRRVDAGALLPQVEPGEDDDARGVGGEPVHALARRARHVVDDNRRRPGAALIGGAIEDQIAVGAAALGAGDGRDDDRLRGGGDARPATLAERQPAGRRQGDRRREGRAGVGRSGDADHVARGEGDVDGAAARRELGLDAGEGGDAGGEQDGGEHAAILTAAARVRAPRRAQRRE